MQEERQSYQLMDQEDRPDFVPTAFDSLRQVPALHSTAVLPSCCAHTRGAQTDHHSPDLRRDVYQKVLKGRYNNEKQITRAHRST